MRTTLIIVVVILYEVVSIGLCGVYVMLRNRRRAKMEGTDTSFDTGQGMTWPIVGASLALSLLGTVKIFGIMQQAINMGAIVAWFSVATIFPLIMISLGTGRWVHRLKVRTMPELYGKMFGPRIRLVTCSIIALQTFIILTVETQGLGTVFNALTAGKISIGLGAVIGGCIGIFYVILAGMDQVGAVNIVNVVVMYIALVAAAILLGNALPGNGWADFQNYFMTTGQENLLAFMGTPGLFFSFAINNILALLFAQSVSQMGVQAALGARDERQIKRAVLVSAPVNGIFGLITMSIGLAGKYMVDSGQMILPEGVAENGQGLGTQMIIQIMPTWVVILLLAAFLGAILSTFAITTMALGSMFTANIFSLRNPNATGKQKQRCIRIMICIFGVIAMILAPRLPSIINSANWSFNWITPTFFILIFGLFWKQSAKAAAWTLAIPWVEIILFTFTPLPAMMGIEGWPLIFITAPTACIVGLIAFGVCKGEKGYMTQFKETHVAKPIPKRVKKAASSDD